MGKFAIDGDLTTNSLTSYSSTGWWQAKMEHLAKVQRIDFYLSKYQFDQGYLGKLKVETKLTYNDAWTECKGEFAVTSWINPYEVKCDQDTNAGYIRISTNEDDGIQLLEVKVYGTVLKGILPTLIYLNSFN